MQPLGRFLLVSPGGKGLDHRNGGGDLCCNLLSAASMSLPFEILLGFARIFAAAYLRFAHGQLEPEVAGRAVAPDSVLVRVGDPQEPISVAQKENGPVFDDAHVPRVLRPGWERLSHQGFPGPSRPAENERRRPTVLRSGFHPHRIDADHGISAQHADAIEEPAQDLGCPALG